MCNLSNTAKYQKHQSETMGRKMASTKRSVKLQTKAKKKQNQLENNNFTVEHQKMNSNEVKQKILKF